MLSKAGLNNLTKYLNSSSQVLLRTDFNVPIKQGKIKDVKRIVETIPTIQQILRHNPKSLVILSHMGRPNGQRVPQLSLKPVLPELQKLLNRKITFLDQCVGQTTLSQVKNSKNQIFLCENVRYYSQQVGHIKKADGTKIKVPIEKINAFKSQLSELGDCFVNDAFGTAHRAHSSVVGINHRYRVAGYLMQKQLKFLGNFLQNPKRPVLAILGGAKVADKLMLVRHMLKFADEIILGGGMKNPFLTQVFNKKLGDSINILPDDPKQLNQIIYHSKKINKTIHFPIDYRVAKSEQMRAPKQVKIYKQSQDVPKGYQVFDIGTAAQKQYEHIIERAGSIFWNGPVGVIEVEQFRKGSEAILRSMIKATKHGETTIVGGGDSASLVSKLKVQKQLTFVSTGGGATIELFEGKILPGVQALSDIKQLQQH